MACLQCTALPVTLEFVLDSNYDNIMLQAIDHAGLTQVQG